ncbi:MAG: NAD(P)H-dependent glycerol-3-phosphate dehydrogenase [bacterium]
MPPTRPDSVSVIGAGSWGTALALLLAHNIAEVRLWGRDRALLDEIARARCNRRYLPDAKLPQNISLTPDFDAMVEDSDSLCFVLAVPCHAFRARVEALRDAIAAAGRASADATVVWGSKGFEPDSGKLLGEVVAETLGAGAVRAVLSGPSFAAETARGLPTALTLACDHRAAAQAMADWFRAPATRVYFSDDLIGVQLGGAIKNVMAIAAGISDGLGFGANARAALIARGLAELTRLGVALGGRAETFRGLAGVGDLVLTCTDDQSRNRRFGLGIGQGRAQAEVRREIGQEIEGINSARELRRASAELGIEMPITEQVYQVLHRDRDPKLAVQALLQRDAKSEHGESA